MSSRSAGATYGVPGWVGTPKTVSQKIRKEVSKQTHAVGRKKKLKRTRPSSSPTHNTRHSCFEQQQLNSRTVTRLVRGHCPNRVWTAIFLLD